MDDDSPAKIDVVVARKRRRHLVDQSSLALLFFSGATKIKAIKPAAIATVFLVTVNTCSTLNAQQVFPTTLPKLRNEILTNDVLRYRMVAGVSEVGEMTTTIRRDSIAGVIHILESSSGLFERTTALMLRDDTTLRPLSSNTVITQNIGYQHIRLQYEKERVHGEVERPVAFGGMKKINAALRLGTADQYAVHHLLRAHKMTVGSVITFPIYNAVLDKTVLVRGWVAAKDWIAVPFGSMQCYRIEGFSGSQRWILYVQTDFPHRLIKRTYPALGLAIELVTANETEQVRSVDIGMH